jgi:hypothetical protein
MGYQEWNFGIRDLRKVVPNLDFFRSPLLIFMQLRRARLATVESQQALLQPDNRRQISAFDWHIPVKSLE